MWIFLLLGLFCLLAVIGYFATGKPFRFAVGGMVTLTAIIFALLVATMGWALISPCSMPLADHTNCQNQPASPTTGSYSDYTTQQTQTQPTYSQSAQTTQTQAGAAPPSRKCVTESGVKICDLSYQSTDEVGSTRTITMPADEIICHDMTTGLNEEIRSETGTISTDPEFCASDYGAVYIDPTIYVSKYYGDIQSSGQNYSVPSSEIACVWTYVGGSAAIPYVQAGSYIGPDTSYAQVAAFCQSGPKQMDILTALQ